MHKPKIVPVLFGILTVILGCVFILFQFQNLPVSDAQALSYTGYFDRCESGENYFSVYLTDGTSYNCYPHTLSAEQRQRITSLKSGTPLYLRVNPRNNCIAELKTDTETLLAFEETQQTVASYSNGYVIIGAVICCGGVFLIVYTLFTSSHDKKEQILRDEKVLLHEQGINSTPLHQADTRSKSHVFLQKNVYGLDICYRRVNHTNELVINGYVYDQRRGIFEFDHTLTAMVDGHIVEVGLDDTTVFLSVDNNLLEFKQRFL